MIASGSVSTSCSKTGSLSRSMIADSGTVLANIHSNLRTHFALP